MEIKVIYLYELKKYSFFKGSFPELILIYIIFFYSLFYFLKKDIIKKNILKLTKCDKNLKLLEYIIFFIILIYNFYFLQKTLQAPYYKLNVDRFVYNKIMFTKIEFFFFRLHPLVIMILSYFYLNIRRLIIKLCVVLNIIIIFLILFLSGNKFGEFISLVFYVFLILLPLFYKNIKKLKKMFKILLTMLSVIILLTYTHKKMYDSNYNFNKFYNYVIQRGAQQGQLWWGTYDKKYEGSVKEVILELKNGQAKYLYNKQINEQTGIWKIMLLNAPQQIVEDKYESGSRYSCSSKASINYYFGLIGNIIFSILSARLFSFLYTFFYMKYNNILLEILKYFLFLKLYGRLMVLTFMSDFWILSDIKTIMLLIMAYTLLKYKKFNKFRRENVK